MQHRFIPLLTATLILSGGFAAAQPPGYSSREDPSMRQEAVQAGREVKISLAWGDQLKPPSQYTRFIINLRDAMVRWTQVPVSIGTQFQIGSPDLMKQTIVIISVDQQFSLSPGEKQNLKDFIAKGGFLVLDDAAASMPNSQSAASLRQMIKDLVGSRRLEPIPVDHPIYRTPFELGGPPLGSDTATTRVGTLSGTNPATGSPSTLETTVAASESPTLEGITMNGRLAILFCTKGYTPKWNAMSNNEPQLKFGVNLIMYALQKK